MKKIKLFLLSMLFILLSACNSTGKLPEVQQEDNADYYQTEKVMEADFNFRCRSVWKSGEEICILGTDRNAQADEFLRINPESGETAKTVLNMEDLILGLGIQSCIDESAGIHTLCYQLDGTETQIDSFYLCTISPQGEVIEKKDYTDVIKPYMQGFMFPYRAVVFQDGRLLFSSQDKSMNYHLVMLSADGKTQFDEKLGQGSLCDLILDENGQVLYAMQYMRLQSDGTNGVAVGRLDLQTGKSEDLVMVPDNCKFAFGNTGDDIYYITGNALWSFSEKEQKIKKQLLMEDLALNGYSDVAFAYQMQDQTWRFLAVTGREAGEYNYFDYNLLSVKKSSEQRKEKTELTLAVTGSTVNLYQDKVRLYNTQHEDVKITIRTYEDEAAFITDLTAGNIPDLVDIGEGDIYETLARKGLLEDLRTYIAKDDEISEEDFLPKSLEFYAEDGKLYSIPYGMCIFSMMGDEEVLGNRQSWSFEEYIDFVKSLPDPYAVTKVLTKQQMMDVFCTQYLDEFVDKDTHTCDFRKDSFYSLLKAASIYSDHELENEEWQRVLQEMANGEVSLIPIEIPDVFTYELWRGFFASKGKLIGFPAKEGSGIYLMPSFQALAMTGAGTHKEEAWAFEKSVLTTQNIGYTTFPSYRKYYDAMIKEERKDAESADRTGTASVNGNFTIATPNATSEEIDMLEEILDSAAVMRSGNEAILRIIGEETGAYFNGNKTPEQVAEIIENRVRLYLAE